MSVAQVPRMLRSGMNVVGIIDKNKTGTIKYDAYELRVYSIGEAFERFGTDVKIIITIANEKIFSNVATELASAGFCLKDIYSYDVYNWLMVKSDRCYCEELFTNINYFSDGMRLCCYQSADVSPFFFEQFDRGMTFNDNIHRAIEKLKYYREKAEDGYVPLHCRDCPKLTAREVLQMKKYNHFSYGSHSVCNLDCIYCEYSISTRHLLGNPFYPPDIDINNFFQFLDAMDSEGMLEKNSELVLGGGELSILPNQQKIREYIQKHLGNKVIILSNCVVHSDLIEESLSNSDNNSLICDLDAGTPETYLLVKGFNYYDKVVDNLRVYSRVGRVVLKYLVIPDFNTYDADFIGQIQLCKELGLRHIILSQDALHGTNFLNKRKTIFYIGKFMSMLKDNGITSTLHSNYFSKDEEYLTSRYSVQYSTIKRNNNIIEHL